MAGALGESGESQGGQDGTQPLSVLLAGGKLGLGKKGMEGSVQRELFVCAGGCRSHCNNINLVIQCADKGETMGSPDSPK